MPYELPLHEPLGSQGWKVKIFDNEPPDDPHATVIFKTKKWRWKLREQSFMDDDPPPREVPREVVAAMSADREELIRQWDRIHPEQPVYTEG
jgi:hypothetical protein